MHNAIPLLTGAGLLLLGVVLGRWVVPWLTPARTRCRTCRHGLGFHQDKTGQCQITFPPDKGKHERMICACNLFDGPMPDYFAPKPSA